MKYYNLPEEELRKWADPVIDFVGFSNGTRMSVDQFAELVNSQRPYDFAFMSEEALELKRILGL